MLHLDGKLSIEIGSTLVCEPGGTVTVPEPEQSLGIATALVALAALRAGTRLAKCRTPQ